MRRLRCKTALPADHFHHTHWANELDIVCRHLAAVEIGCLIPIERPRVFLDEKLWSPDQNLTILSVRVFTNMLASRTHQRRGLQHPTEGTPRQLSHSGGHNLLIRPGNPITIHHEACHIGLQVREDKENHHVEKLSFGLRQKVSITSPLVL